MSNFVLVNKEDNQQLYAGTDPESGDAMFTSDLAAACTFETFEKASAAIAGDDQLEVRRRPNQVVAMAAVLSAREVTFASDPSKLIANTVQRMMLSINATLATADPSVKYDPAAWRISIVAQRPPEKKPDGPKLVKP